MQKTHIQLLPDYSVKGLWIRERYNVLQQLAEQKNEDLSPLHRWRDRTSLVSDENFVVMLDKMGFDKKSFAHSVDDEILNAELSHFKHKVEDSKWFQNYKNSFEILNIFDFDYKPEMGFSYMVRPFLLLAEKELAKFTDEHQEQLRISEEVITNLVKSLAAHLPQIAHKTFILELNVSRLRGELTGDTPTERFHSFVRLFREKERLLDFYQEYATLARMLVTATHFFIQNSVELLERWMANRNKICDFFKIGRDAVITDIIPGEGDTHQQGRTVMKLNFSSGDIIVYKPRALEVATAYCKFIDWLNRKNRVLYMPYHRILAFSDYAFEEFIPKKSCANEDEVQNYYIRFGQLIAIMHVLHGSDFHMENLIANGQYPYIVDLETLVQNNIKYNFPQSAHIQASYELLNLVSSTALLPEKSFKVNVNNREGIDLSALDGQGQKLPYKVLGPVNPMTDEARYDLIEGELPDSNNIPQFNGIPVSYKAYVEYIISGFKEASALIIDNKAELLDPDGVLSAFKQVKVRILLRNTSQYAGMLDSACHPDYMRDAIRREQLLENIWSFPFSAKEAIKSEYEDMIDNDIPIFFNYTDSCDLIDSRGNAHPHFFDRSGYDIMIEQLQHLKQEDIEKQVSVILVHTGGYDPTKLEIIKPLKFDDIIKSQPHADQNIFVSEAAHIGDRIMDSAIASDDRKTVSWLCVNSDPVKIWSIGPINADFYDGLSGLVLFYYYLHKMTKTEKYKHFYELLISSVEARSTDDLDSISSLTGKSSLLYPLMNIAKEEKNKKYEDLIQKIVDNCDEHVNKTEDSSWLNGITSFIHLMLDMFKRTNDLQYLTLSIKYGHYGLNLLEKQQGALLGGFSHGASSAAWVFMRLGHVCRVRKFTDKAKELLEFDRALFSHKHQGWLDKREDSPICKHHWCHGTVGIALSRMRLKEWHEDSRFEQEIEQALHFVLHSDYYADDTLCHGNMGTAELFLSLYEHTNNEQYLYMATAIAAHVIDTSKHRGDYQSRSLSGFPSIGMFTGLAGIGYQLLRMADVKSIPSVLTLASQ